MYVRIVPFQLVIQVEKGIELIRQNEICKNSKENAASCDLYM
jgi:hypothetical protein